MFWDTTLPIQGYNLKKIMQLLSFFCVFVQEEELLSLVKTVNEENSVGSQLTSALEEAQKSMEALKGK